MKYKCSCCGFYTLGSGDEHEICPVCFWEKDKSAEKYPDYVSGANKVCLNDAKINFAVYGACEERFSQMTRRPFSDEEKS